MWLVAAGGELVSDAYATPAAARRPPARRRACDPVLGLLEDVAVLALALLVMLGGDAPDGADLPVAQPELSGSALAGSA